MSDQFNHITEERDKRAEYDAIPVISYEELVAKFHKWLLISDEGIIDLLIGVIFSNRLPSDPVWLNLIAPSSGGKTELLNCFLKVPDCYHLSDLTSNTFLSGYKSKDKTPSLLHQLGTGKTLIFKDFTSLLDGNWDELKTIMGQFRQIFDGYATKRLGTGDEITWKGKLGFIAGSTPIIEQKLSIVGAMGERFLNYYMKQPRRAALRAKMKENVGKELEMRDDLQNGVAGFLKGLKTPEEIPRLPEEIETIIESLTDFIAISRSVVIRSSDSKKEIDWIAPPEMSGRVFKQLYTFSTSLYIIHGQWHDRFTNILRNMAISSIHSLRYNLIKQMLAYRGEVKTATLAMGIGYPTSTVRRYLEDLAAISMDEGTIRILNRTHQGNGKPDLWSITTEMRDILRSMGENVEATKEDTHLTDDEEDVPVGVKGNGHYNETKQKEVDELTVGMSDEEKATLGI